MPDFLYPSAQTITSINQTFLPTLTMDDPLFDLLPIETVDDDILRWEQQDNFKGLQQVRGLNGDPPKVARVGLKGYLMEPGYYGEFAVIDEREITRRRAMGTFGTALDITDLVMEVNRQLLSRRIDRIRYIGWTLLGSGIFAVSNVNGVVMHTDSYNNQTYTASVPWSTYATADPLADLRAVQLLSSGYSVDMGASATLYINRVQANRLLSNTNQASIAGRRTGGFGTFNSIDDLNKLLTMDDLPNIKIYDKGYYNDAGVFTRFIPTSTGIVVGHRDDNAPIGAYRMTRNATNPDAAPGPYTMVEDSMEQNRPPRRLAVHDGLNGGPVLYWPSAVVSMSI